MTATVSVIIPAYNAEKFISKTLDSVLNQTFKSWECIIIDDGSTDETVEIVNSYCSRDNRFQCLLGQHGGVSRARNLGIARSQGQFVALLDHDDLWAPTKLEKQVEILIKRSEVGLVYCDAYYQSPEKTELHSKLKKPYQGKVFHHLVRGNFIMCQTVLVRKELLFERKAPFTPELEMAEEFELFLWISARSEVAFVDEPLATYVVHGGNDSLKRYDLILDEFVTINNMLKNDSVVKSLRGSKKALSFFLLFADHERILIQWKRGQSVLRNYFRFIRGCSLKTEWRYLLAMPFISFQTYEKLKRSIKIS